MFVAHLNLNVLLQDFCNKINIPAFPEWKQILIIALLSLIISPRLNSGQIKGACASDNKSNSNKVTAKKIKSYVNEMETDDTYTEYSTV